MPLYLPLPSSILTRKYWSQQNMKLEKGQTNVFQDWVRVCQKTLSIYKQPICELQNIPNECFVISIHVPMV